jgi:hypothetical protein
MRSAAAQITGRPREDAVFLIFIPVVLLLFTPFALPEAKVAWVFGWGLSISLGLWGLALHSRRSIFDLETKRVIRQFDPWGLFTFTHPVTDFVVVARQIRCNDGDFFAEVVLIRPQTRANFVFATGRAFNDHQQAAGDADTLTLAERLASATELPLHSR